MPSRFIFLFLVISKLVLDQHVSAEWVHTDDTTVTTYNVRLTSYVSSYFAIFDTRTCDVVQEELMALKSDLLNWSHTASLVSCQVNDNTESFCINVSLQFPIRSDYILIFVIFKRISFTCTPLSLYNSLHIGKSSCFTSS